MNTTFESPVIVVGSGRSGTSIVASMLHKLGVHMGDDFIEADRNNVGGTFEDVDFTALNRVFLAGGMKEEKFREKARKLVQVKGIQQRKWGWKIPCTSQLLHIYLEYVPDAKVIWCGRPFNEFVESCRKAYGWSEEKSEGIFKERVSNLESSAPNHTLKLQFSEMLENTEVVVDKIVDYLGLTVSESLKEEAVKLVYDKSKTENAKILVVCLTGNLVEHVSVSKVLRQIDKDGRYETDIRELHGHPLSHIRNKIAQITKEENFDFVLMIDDDNPPKKNPLDLVELNKDVVGLPTPIMQDGSLMFNVVSAIDGHFRPVPGRLQQGLMEVDAVGGGCMLIQKNVLETLEKPFGFLFDEEGIKTRGEDFAFCMRAKEAGFEVWTHWDYKCSHWKKVDLLKFVEALKDLEI